MRILALLVFRAFIKRLCFIRVELDGVVYCETRQISLENRIGPIIMLVFMTISYNFKGCYVALTFAQHSRYKHRFLESISNFLTQICYLYSKDPNETVLLSIHSILFFCCVIRC